MSDIVKIITIILGISVLTLIINKASDSANLIKTTGTAFDGILKTITLQA